MRTKRFSISLSALSIISVAASAVAAVTICTVIFSGMYINSLLGAARVSSEQAVNRAALSVDSYFESVTEKLSLINEVISDLETGEEAESRLSAFTFIEKDIYAISVYDENGNLLSCIGGRGKRKNYAVTDLSFDKALFDSETDFSVSSPHVQTLFENEYPWVVTVAKALDKPVLTNGKYIAADFMFSDIAQSIGNIGIGNHGYCFVMDKNGEIVYHPQQQLIFSGLKSENTGYILSLGDGTFNEKNVIYSVKTTGAKGWRTVAVSYTDSVAAEKRLQIFVSVALSFLFCALIIFTVLKIYSKKVNTPVKSLIRAMKNFETDADNTSFSYTPQPVAEINVLTNSFCQMSVRIKALMERIRKEEKELRKIELKALQAQINPHFLYNTLDSVQWMCERGKTDSAAQMVSALGRLFRISISRGKELIPIRDEILHAKSYLVIQSFRYRDQFSYTFDVDNDLEKYYCNKITVQPLIENAIYHGIDRLVDEGEITISVKTADDNENDILITVSDNGVGMTKEQCAKILAKEGSDSGGIGVKNVNDRLKIYFGEKYGISIDSEPDMGTRVTVRIPKMEKEELPNDEINP